MGLNSRIGVRGLLAAVVGLVAMAWPDRAAAQLSINPTMLNFGTVLVGNPSPPQNVTITNTGGAELTISTIALSGSNPNNFNVDNMGKFTLTAGQSKVVTVTYQPVAAGMHTASLVITPMGFAPAQVKLNGVAVQPLLQVSTGQTPPTVLDFDIVFPINPVGRDTDALQVGVKVPSNGIALSLDRVVSSGPEFRVDTSAWSPNLSPGATTQFDVVFHPTTAGLQQAKLDIYVKGVANPLATVTAKGSGIAPPPSADGGGAKPDLAFVIPGGDGFHQMGGGTTAGCTLARGGSGGGPSALWGVALLLSAIVGRRRRRGSNLR